MTVKRIAKLGEIVYANPGDYFGFTPPKPGRMYRFQVGPANGALFVAVWRSDVGPTEAWISNYDGEDFVDAVCHDIPYAVTVDGCRTAYQFVVTCTPNSFLAWIKNLMRTIVGGDFDG